MVLFILYVYHVFAYSLEEPLTLYRVRTPQQIQGR